MSESVASTTLSSIYNNSFTKYLKYSEIIGGTIFEQSISVNNVFKTTLELIKIFGNYRKPLKVATEREITNPLFQEINQVLSFETKAAEFIFQITLISKSIKIFEWITEANTEIFVDKVQKYIQFYQQKAQCEIEGLGRTHFEWLNSWNETFEEFSVFIVNFFKNGVVWTGGESLNYVLGDSYSGQRSIVFNDINKGETAQNILSVIPEESKLFNKLGQKWSIQNQKDRHNDLVLNTAQKEDDVCISNCEDCTIVIENLISIIRLTVCKRVTVLFRNASKLEVINCTDCNLHCFERISIIDMISCEKCGIHLSDKSLDSSIVTKKCSGICVNFPFEDGLYHNFTISDQLKTNILPNKGIETIVKQ